MAEVDSTAVEVGRFRSRRRILALAVGLNLLLSLVFIVVPYVNGHLRAKRAQERFASFAGCVWGGSPIVGAGLGLPAGERERFAYQVVQGPADWPGRCRSLADVVDRPSIAVLPRVREAEEQVRKTIRLVERELRSLERARASSTGRVPDRPHRALDRMRASLAVLMETVGIELDPSPAIRFDPGEPRIAAPARIPLRLGEGAQLLWRSSGGSLEVAALGRHRIARVRVQDGGVRWTVFQRPSNAWSLVGDGGDPWVVQYTADEHCRSDARGCRSKSTGVWSLTLDDLKPKTPGWLGGHPAVRATDALIESESGWRLIARGLETLEVLTFGVRGGETPVAPTSRQPLESTSWTDDAVFFSGGIAHTRKNAERPGGSEVVVAALVEPGSSQDSGAQPPGAAEDPPLSEEAGRAPVRAVGWLEGEGVWLKACNHTLVATSDQRVIVYNVLKSLQIASVDRAFGPKAPLAENDPISIVCAGGESDLLLRPRDGSLLWLRCGTHSCEAPVEIARTIRHAAIARRGSTRLIAYAGDAANAQIRVRWVRDREVSEPQVPAACWSLESGFCGQPYVAIGEERWVVAARMGGDLLAVESSGPLVPFVALQGL